MITTKDMALRREVGSSRNLPKSLSLATEESSHHCTQPTDAVSRPSWQAGVCKDNQEWEDLLHVAGNLNGEGYLIEVLNPVAIPYIRTLGAD